MELTKLEIDMLNATLARCDFMIEKCDRMGMEANTMKELLEDFMKTHGVPEGMINYQDEWDEDLNSI